MEEERTEKDMDRGRERKGRSRQKSNRKMQYTNRKTERLLKRGRETTAQDSNRRRWCRRLEPDNRRITDKSRDKLKGPAPTGNTPNSPS